MTRVAIMWHMHQPFYEDLATGEHVLPWVRLHALKDYYGMPALLREFPDVKVTFNLVPSLLVQLEAFSRDEARDRHLQIGLTPADLLTDDERMFCIDQFFHAHRRHMIDPYPRYAELWMQREKGRAQGAHGLTQFSTADIRDLQVWHKLAWIDPSYHASDSRIRRLVEKGRDYAEDDKLTLREVELEVLRRVIPEYRDGAARGQIELSTSPFYHPILPLLCDSDVYLRTHPETRKPRERFQRPEDAVEQIARAMAYHERIFGARPGGLWPSEGSVSDEMVPIVSRAGISWIATDEEILGRTLERALSRDGHGHSEQAEILYQPYRVGRAEDSVAIAFRDHVLSDLIGFSYASWAPEQAAADFVGRLEEAGRRYHAAGGGDATISVVLDGENAWETYQEGGRPFLRALYRALSGHSALRTVTMSEACSTASTVLPSIHPGSWINGDFYIWIGHEDDRRAWSQLADARKALDATRESVAPAFSERAYTELLIAEGSDWFWWYGDDHSSEHDLVFDDLFRRHVRNAYRALEQPIPEELFVTNISTVAQAPSMNAPVGPITPIVDGEITSYFEWLAAGCLDVDHTAGTMHQAAADVSDLRSILFGTDGTRLYVCVSAARPLATLLASGVDVAVKFLNPAGFELTVRAVSSGGVAGSLVRGRGSAQEVVSCSGVVAAAGSVLEVGLPLACIGVDAGELATFVVALKRGELEVERHPEHRPLEIRVPR